MFKATPGEHDCSHRALMNLPPLTLPEPAVTFMEDEVRMLPAQPAAEMDIHILGLNKTQRAALEGFMRLTFPRISERETRVRAFYGYQHTVRDSDRVTVFSYPRDGLP